MSPRLHLDPTPPSEARPELSRRRLLQLFGGTAAVVAGGAVLSACGSSSSAPADDGNLGTVGMQLVFIKNVQFAGSFFADSKGYWKSRGLTVDLLAGGPNATVEPIVQSGKALVGIAHTAQAAQAIINGADLKIIGAGFQKNPFVLISRGDAPIKSPNELAGKKIGVQSNDLPVFTAFLAANKIDQSTFTIVPLQSDPSPLANGEVNGIMGFYSNEPNTLRLKGVDPYVMRLDDFGYVLMEEVYVAKQASLDDDKKRAQIVALMQGESLGWTDALADPQAAADLAVNVYGKDLSLNPKQQLMAMQSEVDLVKTPDTTAHGLFWMSDDLIAGTVKSLQIGGVQATPDMFTRQVLDAVYQGKATV